MREIAKILHAGGVVIFPTDTIYGLLCDATNPAALLKIYQLKKRELGKAFPLLIKDFKMLADFANFNSEHKKIIAKAKKPTTFVLRCKNLSPLATQRHTAAFRVPKGRLLKKLFRYFDKPLVATSANLAGQLPLNDSRKYVEAFGKVGELIDAVVFSGINRKRKGSRIVDLTKRPYKILRA